MTTEAGQPRTRVATRLYRGFAALIVISLLVAGAGLWGIQRLSGQLGKIETVGNHLDRALTTRIMLETIRRTQLRVMLDGDAKAVATMKAAQTRAAAVLTASASASAPNALSAERRHIYQTVSSQLEELTVDAAKVVDLNNTTVAAKARLVTGGDAPTAATNTMMQAARAANGHGVETAAPSAERALLLARLQNWRALATSDAKGPDKFHAAAQQANQALDALDRPAGADVHQAIVAVRAVLAAYAQDFDAATTAILAQKALFMGTQVPRIADLSLISSCWRASVRNDIVDAPSVSARFGAMLRPLWCRRHAVEVPSGGSIWTNEPMVL